MLVSSGRYNSYICRPHHIKNLYLKNDESPIFKIGIQFKLRPTQSIFPF